MLRNWTEHLDDAAAGAVYDVYDRAVFLESTKYARSLDRAHSASFGRGEVLQHPLGRAGACPLHRYLCVTSWFFILGIVFTLPTLLHAQARGQAAANRGAAPLTGRTAAPFDITGYWVALVTDDWRYRMLTPPKGNVDYLPVNAEGRRVTEAWDPAKDEANGDQCKAYGAGGVMRLPGRLHITWENDNTLRIDTDAGTQTRRFYFGGSQPPPAQPSLQGYSVARWDLPGSRRGAATVGYGQLTVTTTHLRPGYLRKNGVPYSGNATLNEYFLRLVDKGSQEYLALTIAVDDPQYLQQPYLKTYQYKKQADASGWNPSPCSAR